MSDMRSDPAEPSEKEILSLLAAAGIEAEVVHRGPEGRCPACRMAVERAA